MGQLGGGAHPLHRLLLSNIWPHRGTHALTPLSMSVLSSHAQIANRGGERPPSPVNFLYIVIPLYLCLNAPNTLRNGMDPTPPVTQTKCPPGFLPCLPSIQVLNIYVSWTPFVLKNSFGLKHLQKTLNFSSPKIRFFSRICFLGLRHSSNPKELACTSVGVCLSWWPSQ